MNHKHEDILLSELLMQCPAIKGHVVEYYMFSFTELIAVLDDGRQVLFDWTASTFRYFVPSETCEDEDRWRMELARRLYKKMTMSGMDQTMLSERTGISRVTINKYMTGKATPSLYNAEKLAEAMRCRLSDLVNFPTRTRKF